MIITRTLRDSDLDEIRYALEDRIIDLLRRDCPLTAKDAFAVFDVLGFPLNAFNNEELAVLMAEPDYSNESEQLG